MQKKTANAIRDYQGQQGHQQGERGTRLTQAQQCRLQRLTGSQPSQRIRSEGGFTELWDEQFQCAGVAPMRNVIRRNSLSLPNFHPMPRLVYIEQGRGLIGITNPGCAETFQSQSQTFHIAESKEGPRQQKRPAPESPPHSPR
ncbi:hypothetical protein HAX54_034220 [Datura stramonium]|uniref:Cupin type-1 domain-containing protein n=1 Tax=Datura stramonium TaxID=4076 RepID=A0ABS8VF72_DATST|nr:hypothetical protein [Datura stramonium]